MSQGEADKDADGDDNAGDDGGLVSQSQTKDDVSGSAGLARVSHILHNTEPPFRLNAEAMAQGPKREPHRVENQTAHSTNMAQHTGENQTAYSTSHSQISE